MRNLVGWIAYYDDGTERSSHEQSWGELPVSGILAVVEFYDDNSRVIHHSRDYYVLDDGKAYGTNNIHPYLMKLGTVKYGRWSKDSLFSSILEKAKHVQYSGGNETGG